MKTNNVVLVISFSPSRGNQSVAQDFACDLTSKSKDGPTKTEIRARNMSEFDKLLVQQLRDVKQPAEAERPIIQIKRSPFPGENVIRRVGDKVRVVLPAATVVSDE